MTKYIISFVLLYGAVIFSACNNKTPKANMSYEQDKAHADYINYCAGCHGTNLEKFTAVDWETNEGSKRIFNAIKLGISQEGMPAYDTTFSDDEIQQMTAYLKKRRISSEEVVEKEKEGVLKFVSEDYKINAVPIADNLEIPWSLQMLPGGRILVTEKKGELSIVNTDGSIEKVSGLPKVRNQGQGGLLDVKLHPNYDGNGLVFLSYSKPKEALGTTAVIVAQLVDNELKNVKEIFEALPYVGASHHYAGRLLFDKAGHLFISVGDRGNENAHPQFLSNFNGKIHRINTDGSIPSDNPFAKDASAITSIYSYGHRNPQGLALRADGTIWENEHGPKGGDEINKILPAKNYGWPLATFGINYNGTIITNNSSLPQMMDPISQWTPSMAPSSMCFVNTDTYKKWTGNLLSSSLKFNYIARSILEGDKVIREEKLLEGIGRIRNVVQLADGKIYISLENPGRIYRLDVTEK